MASATAYCTLQAVIGWAEPCSGRACAFWDAKADGCLFEDVGHELEGRPALARHLLDLRSALERGDETERARFFHRLNEELEADDSACSRGECAA
jgi:hypothetical protein